MKPEIKKIWLEALRSGNYKQGKGVLNCNGKFCCLGVLADLYSEQTDHPWVSSYPGMKMHGLIAKLSNQLLDWSGITTSLGRYSEGSLVDDNDKGKSFLEIADIIEKHF